MFVADVENKGNLKDILKEFGKKYNQDSVLFRPKGGKSRLIITRGKKFGNETKDSHATSYGNSTNANYSKVGGRTFSDAIDIDDDWWPEDEEEIFMKKETIFRHEINESVQANAAMKCLKNRNNIKKINESADFDERFAYRKDLRNVATPITKKAYMIIRKEYGDNMWRVLGMDDCDERGLIDMLNYMQEQFNITDPQDLADVQLGRKSIRSFKKQFEEQEESTLSESEIEELAFKLTDYLIESFITLENEDEDYSKLYEAVEKILKKDAPNPESTKECYAWCKKWYQKIEDLNYSYNNYPNPESYYTEEEEGAEDYNDIQSKLADAWDDSMIEDDVFDPYDNKFDKVYDDLVWKLISAIWKYFEAEADVDGFNIFNCTEKQIGNAVEQILDKHDDMPSSNDFKKCYSWVKKHAEEIIKILETGSLENTYEEHPEFDFNEQEEMPQMERHDMILALSEYMSESWIDTGDDGDLDDIYYAIADILDETGDYPASTSWEDCKPWCRKYYKQVEARIQ